MKRSIMLILLSLLTLTSAFAYAVEIGDGTETTREMPANGYYGYNWSHFILPVDNINPMLIDQLEFNVSNSPENYSMNNQTVYLRLTTESTVSTAYTSNPLAAGYTEVFNGSVTWNGLGWQGINLSNPFYCSESSNIEVIWENRAGQCPRDYPYFYTTAANSVGVYNQSGSSFPASAGSSANYYPNTRITGTIPAISSVTPTPGTTNTELTPTLSLEVSAEYQNYELYFGNTPNPETALTDFSEVTNPISYTFTEPLEYLTDYYWTLILYGANYEVTTLNFTFKTRPTFAGSGTEADPYQIATINDLIDISEHKAIWDKHFSQTANIDASSTSILNEGAGFSPIGINYDNSFTGSYNGNGYTISNLKINRPSPSFIGLFGYTQGANISNVGLVDNEINGSSSTGGLVGSASSSTISNSYATGAVSGTDRIGGIVGYLFNSSTISNSYATGAVSGSSNSVGGLVGSAQSSSPISNSYATGAVSGSSSSVGGLVGYAYSSPISNSYATGAVSGTSSNVGGLVGYGRGTVTNSFWDMETSGQTSSQGGTGKTTQQMQDINTYLSAGWDFATIWLINPIVNSGYPAFTNSYISNIAIPAFAINVSLIPTISFEVAEDYVACELYFGNTPNPETAIISFSAVTNPISYIFTEPLEYLTDYYWRVILYDVNYEVTTLNFTFNPSLPFLKNKNIFYP